MKNDLANNQGANTNQPPTKTKAAALKYDGEHTPKVVAKGEGELAEEIIKIAKQNQVHIHYDPLLLEVLSRLELNEEIPETLYLAVAKIIAFAYYLQGKHPKGYQASVPQDDRYSKQDAMPLTSDQAPLEVNLLDNKSQHQGTIDRANKDQANKNPQKSRTNSPTKPPARLDHKKT